jgi:hypothetical protein
MSRPTEGWLQRRYLDGGSSNAAPCQAAAVQVEAPEQPKVAL